MKRSLSIRVFPDPVLRKAAMPVKMFDRSLRALVRALDRTMRRQTHGIGIAAPQIGISRRVAIVDVSSRVQDAKKLVLVNPVIVMTRGVCLSREGCMSIPDYTANIRRAEAVRVRWQDEYGHFFEKWADGIEAVCVQHEIDHLDGRLFIDRVQCLKTDMFPRQRKRRKKKGDESRNQHRS